MHRVVRLIVVDVVLVLAWTVSVGLVIQHERGSLLGGGINPLTSLRATADVNEQWFGIYYQDRKIGYAQTMLMPEERRGMPGMAVMDRGRLSFTLLGLPQRVDLSTRAFINADWQLQEFHAELHSEAYRLRWSGHREGERLVVTAETDQGRSTKVLRDPGGRAFVVGLSPWAAFQQLRVGQWGSLWLLNPLALNPEEVYFHVRARELLNGQEALVIDTDVRGMQTTSWVTPDGDVLKEESPLGWALARESMEQALAMDPSRPPLDLLSTTAVPIDRILEDPPRLERLVWLVHGLAADELAVDRPWQTVLPQDRVLQYRASLPEGRWVLVELQRPRPPTPRLEPRPPSTSLGTGWPGALARDVAPEVSRGRPERGAAESRDDEVEPRAFPGGSTGRAVAPERVARYQRPSAFVESDDRRIQATAREIIGRETDPWRQAIALQAWVYQSLTKRLTVGLPSALDVLASRSGDCHEHTILYTALARSAGLPTRMVAGLVYHQGQLYYHAWPEVWVDGWIPTDPTLGQPLADATHLGLLEAETEDLVALGKWIGQLQVSVLEVE